MRPYRKLKEIVNASGTASAICVRADRQKSASLLKLSNLIMHGITGIKNATLITSLAK